MVVLKQDDSGLYDLSSRYELFQREWGNICRQVSRAFKMDENQYAKLYGKNIARLIGAIPYLAGCDIPKQTAASHLAIYILSVTEATKDVFHHRQWTDDVEIMNRLRPISNFQGGDNSIIERAMNLLALNMIAGYERDVEKDNKSGKYNPVSSGSWDSVKLKEEYIEKISNVKMPIMDEIMNIDEGTFEFWGLG